MEHRLSTLDDPTAIDLLLALAAPRLRHEGLQTEDLTPDLRRDLTTAYGLASTAPSEGDLARETLQFLARDPALLPVITAFLDGSRPESFGRTPVNKNTLTRGVAVTVAIVALLQTHLHIERTPEGQWHLLVDKPSTSEELLKPIVQRLLALPPGK
jgi:hypothetical protein